MILKKLGIFTLILLGLWSCDKKEIIIETNLTGKTFVFSYANSQKECTQLQDAGQYNCAALLVFNTSNRLDAIFYRYSE